MSKTRDNSPSVHASVYCRVSVTTLILFPANKDDPVHSSAFYVNVTMAACSGRGAITEASASQLARG